VVHSEKALPLRYSLDFLFLVIKMLSFVFSEIQDDCKMTVMRIAQSKGRYKKEAGMPNVSWFWLISGPKKEPVLFSKSGLSSSYIANKDYPFEARIMKR
jgi:hypothetical protein